MRNLEKTLKTDAAVFRNRLKHPDKTDDGSFLQLKDNFYVLERRSSELLREIRKKKESFKGSGVIPGLFLKCRELCTDGILPEENKIIDFFEKSDGLNGTETELLPLAITCALINHAADGVRAKSSSGSKKLANAIISLRKIAETDFESITESLFKAEKILLLDEKYQCMDEYSKNIYRKRISRLAFKSKKSECEIAQEALNKSQKSGSHIGFFLFGERKSKRNGYIYLVMEIIMPLAASFCLGVFLDNPSVALLAFLPLWEFLRYPIETASLRGVSSKKFLRLSAESEPVRTTHTLITVSTILPSADKMSELGKHLEQIYLSNCRDNIKVCCLADFKAAGMPRKPEDKLIIKSAKEMVEKLNRRYGGGFILAIRPRVHSKTQNEFIGRERKRGAITELVRAIKGNEKGFSLIYGDVSDLNKVKYLFTLDSDTLPVFDSVVEFIAVAEHPLNRPIIKKGRVTSGYGILVPKTEISLESKNSTFFGRLMAGDSGVSSYDAVTGERYQNLFGEGIFCGKGLINVESCYALLDKGMPKERILSHDIVESGYLRAGFVSDIQITEGIPQSVSSYYRRLHRWVRGDWQNIGFIFGKNPLDFVSRYKMFDNLRRSITPVACVLSLLLSLFIDDYASIFVALSSLSALAARNLYPAFSLLLRNGFSSVSRLYFSKTMPPALNLFARAFVSVAFSAREAFVCADAIAKSLWRLLISKKKLLEWTTAAQSEKNVSLKQDVISCVPSTVVAFLLLMFGEPIHRLAGLIILADIPLALFTSYGIGLNRQGISEKQRETVISHAGAMWAFFEDLCGRENNFLPPDNIQFSPVKSTANRTSPTNIGLMFASFLSARDMGFITSSELYMRMNLSLNSVEKLEKYKGNLLNWYSTLTLEPLNPRFVSTVDSGNFLCCLTAVKEGMREYTEECPALAGIIERIEKIISETDLSPMFNTRRNLFHIGLNPVSSEKSNSFYDLYMSEARMTAYFAVASRQVSKKHWGSLGRITVGQGRFTGLASWSGTMFEYFMPELFIPAPEGSLSKEALGFCLYCQRKKAGKLPFGISESGFYSFDRDLNYQYKAHGVQKLALCNTNAAETVISPYSTFLVLSEAPVAAIRNLKKLEKLGLNGIYGLCEAIDFTKGRGMMPSLPVRSYMAHHVGMSIVAINNLVNGRCMQKRFMSDSSMKGAKSLLDEKIQTDSQVFKGVKTEKIPNVRERTHGINSVHNNPDPFSPEMMLLSNGRMTTCISDSGTGITMFDGVDVTVNSSDPFMRPQGVFAVFANEKGVIPFVRALDGASSTDYSASFLRNCAIHTAKKENTLLTMKTTLLQKADCELRSFTVENLSKKESLRGNLIIYFEPCIEKREVYSSHPMFSKLFLTDEKDDANRCVLFSRRSSSDCAVAAGIIENTGYECETSRERVLSSPRGIFSLGELADFGSDRGNPDCCAAFSIKIDLEAKKKQDITLAIATAESKEQALNLLISVRAGKFTKKICENPFYQLSAENLIATEILPGVTYPLLSRGRAKSDERCSYTKNDLWSMGISGDNPVIVVEMSEDDETEVVIPYIRLNKKLRSCGIKTDLAIVFGGEDRYLLPKTNAFKNAVIKEDCGLMTGVSGGIHFVDKTLFDYKNLVALNDVAVFYVQACKNVKSSEKTRLRQLKFIDTKETKNSTDNAVCVKQYNFTEGKISIENNPKILDIPWSHVLSNRSFGTMVSDKALGFTWCINSRENKLTPWYNDLMSDNRGELLIMKYNGVLYDIIAVSDAEFTPDYALWKTTVSGIEFNVKITVAKKGMTKKCDIKIVNKSGSTRNFDLMYFTLPVLGVSKETCGMFYAEKTENGITVENSFSSVGGFLHLCCDEKADYYCLSKKRFFEGNFLSSQDEMCDDFCAAIGKNIILKNGENSSAVFNLSWAANQNAAKIMHKVSVFEPIITNPIKINSKNKNLELFFNSFLYSQIKQTRFWARTGFYQCSGAYGFRDQLQDSLAFLESEPELTLAHIARCASVQFEEGDVLHWWHVTINKKQKISGIRTRCSDDMLWLPYVCIKYREKTGDTTFFDIKAPFLKCEVLSENEKERYFSPVRTDYRESILNHCIRAVDKSLDFGKNGLPLIGSCDWNDGFSKIGESDAESVWLAMFQIIVLEGMAEICNEKDMTEKAKEYRNTADKLRRLTEEKAWCGDRYARIILENGEIFGKDKDFIDILPQAFAVFAGIGKIGRADTALDTALRMLFDGKTVRLLSPSFDEDDRDKVGYIASYPCGIRENGGQYTHAAVWLAKAMFEKGRAEDGKMIIDALNPLSYYEEETTAKQYRAEPYVMAGDVSYGDSVSHRAGWTHFTGSAAWFYRCVAENPLSMNCKLNKTNVKHNGFTNDKIKQKSDKNHH